MYILYNIILYYIASARSSAQGVPDRASAIYYCVNAENVQKAFRNIPAVRTVVHYSTAPAVIIQYTVNYDDHCAAAKRS